MNNGLVRDWTLRHDCSDFFPALKGRKKEWKDFQWTRLRYSEDNHDIILNWPMVCLKMVSKESQYGQSQSKKVSVWWQIPPQHQSRYLGGAELASIKIPTFKPLFIKFSKTVYYEVNLTWQHSYLEELLLSKFGILIDADSGPLRYELLFRLALAILWGRSFP